MMFVRSSSVTFVLAVLLAACAATTPTPPKPEPLPDLEQATAIGPPVVADARERARAHTELGLAYLSDRQYEIALNEARIALDSLDSYAPAYNLKGLVHMALGQNAEAETAFRQALALAPENAEFSNNFGWFLCQTGRVKESYAYFEKALRNPLYKTPAAASLNMGVCKLLDKDDVAAESYLFRALKLDSNALRAYYLLAEIDYRRGRFDEAREWLRKLHEKIEPTAETAWMALRIAHKLGDREGEAANMAILRKKFRDSAEYQLMLRGAFD